MSASDDERYPTQAPGWAAIDQALETVYPGQVPHQYASKTAYDLDSASPLPAISVYEATEPSHWHYVTYGLTELFEKSSPNPEVSGFGFELTLRVPRGEGEAQPPAWGLRLLHGIGGYVLAGHGTLDTGHVIDVGGPLRPPIAQRAQCRLHAVVLVPDPGLGKLETPHGTVLFLQAFGLTPDELELIGSWSLERKVGLVREVEPMGVTDPERPPMRDDRRAKLVLRRYELGVLI